MLEREELERMTAEFKERVVDGWKETKKRVGPGTACIGRHWTEEDGAEVEGRENRRKSGL